MIVMKFGGTSVQNAQMMDATLDIVARQLERAPVLVSSAMAKVTDQLQEIAKLVGVGKEEEALTILAAIEKRHLECARELLEGEPRRNAPLTWARSSSSCAPSSRRWPC